MELARLPSRIVNEVLSVTLQRPWPAKSVRVTGHSGAREGQASAPAWLAGQNLGYSVLGLVWAGGGFRRVFGGNGGWNRGVEMLKESIGCF